jgi:hypothetical protein
MRRNGNYETITKWEREECGIGKEKLAAFRAGGSYPKGNKNQNISCLTDMGSACMP